jgi:hypothetical protein
MEVVAWNNLRIGKKYFVVTNSDISNEKMPVVIRSLNFMNQGEAMIYTVGGYSAYAVGGIFDERGGPMNVFWTDPTEDYSGPYAMPVPATESATSPTPAPAAESATSPTPQPPPPLNLSGIKMSDDDWAMTYGLRRCRICGYNEGPEICPNNCYGVKKDE